MADVRVSSGGSHYLCVMPEGKVVMGLENDRVKSLNTVPALDLSGFGERKASSDVLTLRGWDLQKGSEASVHLVYMPTIPGPMIRWPGCPQGMPAADLARLQRRSERCTILSPSPLPSDFPSLPEASASGDLRVSEHLLAALAFFAKAPVLIDCPQGTLPLLDGSAKIFSEALSSLGQGHGFAPQAPEEYPSQLSLAWTWEQGFLIAEPSDHFQATYEIQRQGYHSSYTLDAAQLAFEEVLPARTFIFYDDWSAARAAGQLRGAQAESGLLLASSPQEEARWKVFAASDQGDLSDPSGLKTPYRVKLPGDSTLNPGLLHPRRYRFPQEPARHKMLDLLGDLALLGLRLPRLRFRFRNAGHHHHHRLLEALIHERAQL